MIRTIKTDSVREHTLTDRKVACPGAFDHDRQSRYGVFAKTGDWIIYRATDAAGNEWQYRAGRVLGRVDAPFVPDDRYPCKAIKGHISVLAFSDNMQFAYIRWIDPKDVAEVSKHPPSKLFAFMTGKLPDAEMVHKLADYGTISERHIDKADHHINAWKHGVSPAAWDSGVRSPKPEDK